MAQDQAQSGPGFRVLHGQNDQAPRVSCRKRVKQKIVKSTERNRGRSSTERQCENGHEREPRVLAQIPNRVPKIAEQVVEMRLPVRIADFLFDAFEASQFEASAAAGFGGIPAVT
ncbi:MAG TPA: hypothetical protein VMR90_03045 [Candidatus Cybelea sp.]|nr:hypothetical protein [Candidatus Cybelea sp.]